MARTHVDHQDLVRFAEDRVNLPYDKAIEYRAQANRLGERLESHLTEHPDFSLRRIQIAGSLAKGTALRTINDIDMAAYISGASAPTDKRAEQCRPPLHERPGRRDRRCGLGCR